LSVGADQSKWWSSIGVVVIFGIWICYASPFLDTGLGLGFGDDRRQLTISSPSREIDEGG
jgi:hypothetical protein